MNTEEKCLRCGSNDILTTKTYYRCNVCGNKSAKLPKKCPMCKKYKKEIEEYQIEIEKLDKKIEELESDIDSFMDE